MQIAKQHENQKKKTKPVYSLLHCAFKEITKITTTKIVYNKQFLRNQKAISNPRESKYKIYKHTVIFKAKEPKLAYVSVQAHQRSN